METSEQVQQALLAVAETEKALVLKNFFRTGPGQYGEGDVFLGVVVPEQRKIAKRFWQLPLNEIKKLLHSEIHEHRLTALLILGIQYKKLLRNHNSLYTFYLQSIERINNWDLVDSSAPNIVGEYIVNNPEEKHTLLQLANSANLWERRIAMIATFAHIKHNQFEIPLDIARILVADTHHLIQKAVGWMLREIGKRDLLLEETFLDEFAKTMPRTMLRYAIEKFDKDKKYHYMSI